MKTMSKYEFYCFAFLLLFMTLPSSTSGIGCDSKEKCFTSLEIAADFVTRLLPNCLNVVGNTSECGAHEKLSAYLDMIPKLIEETKENYSTCIAKTTKYPVTGSPTIGGPKSRDCSEVLQKGHNSSGVYNIWPINPHSPNRPIQVYCDMDTQGGGWTVIQRRGNFTPQEYFYRGWNEYRNGFGNLKRDFWLGNDNLYILSNQGNYTIRFDLMSNNGEKAYALYQKFRVEDEIANYTLLIEGYSGNAGDSMEYHNGMPFSTKDRRNDKHQGEASCAEETKGAWWYNSCSESNLNGEYYVNNNHYSFFWSGFSETIGLASTEIKMKLV